MYGEKDLRKIADIMVETATTKYNDGTNYMSFILMLTGLGKYKLESYPGAGHNYNEITILVQTEGSNFNEILNAIYRYYKMHPDSNIDKIFYERLARDIKTISNIQNLTLDANYILAQLKNEKENIAPFKMDNLSLLKLIKQTVLNKEKLINDPIVINWLNQTDKYLSDNYGHKIL